MTESDIIPLAEALKPHGLRGGVVLRPLLDNLVPWPGERVFLRRPDGGETPALISRLARGGKLIAWFEGIESRADLAALLPFTLYGAGRGIDPDKLIGRPVFCASTEKPLGRVTALTSNGVQWVLEVTGEANFSIPLVEAFVKSINPLKVTPPEYWP